MMGQSRRVYAAARVKSTQSTTCRWRTEASPIGQTHPKRLFLDVRCRYVHL